MADHVVDCVEEELGSNGKDRRDDKEDNRNHSADDRALRAGGFTR